MQGPFAGAQGLRIIFQSIVPYAGASEDGVPGTVPYAGKPGPGTNNDHILFIRKFKIPLMVWPIIGYI